MQMRHFGLVFLALLLSSGIILANRITKVPNWVATVGAVAALVLLALYFVLNKVDAKKEGKNPPAKTSKKKSK